MPQSRVTYMILTKRICRNYGHLAMKSIKNIVKESKIGAILVAIFSVLGQRWRDVEGCSNASPLGQQWPNIDQLFSQFNIALIMIFYHFCE